MIRIICNAPLMEMPRGDPRSCFSSSMKGWNWGHLFDCCNLLMASHWKWFILDGGMHEWCHKVVNLFLFIFDMEFACYHIFYKNYYKLIFIFTNNNLLIPSLTYKPHKKASHYMNRIVSLWSHHYYEIFMFSFSSAFRREMKLFFT